MVEAHQGNAAQVEMWNTTAGRQWVDQQEHMDIVLAPVSAALFAAARLRPELRVIDIGCGCGDTTLEIARRIVPGGRALGLDISEPMLARARERVPAGTPIEFVSGDATIYHFAPAAADLATSRFGVMFFADPVAAFSNIRSGLKSGGRLCFACWRDWLPGNPWMAVPAQAAQSIVPPDPSLPPPDPDAPGPFGLADDFRTRRILGEAGFSDIELAPVDLSLDLAAGRGLDAAIRCAFRIGATSRIVANQPEEVVARVGTALAAALEPYRRGQTIPLGASIWIVTATNP